MANPQGITIPIGLPRDEATAFTEFLKRTSYEDCLHRSNRLKRHSGDHEEADVMWSALRRVENQFAEGGLQAALKFAIGVPIKGRRELLARSAAVSRAAPHCASAGG
jgi:hypothetical protein